MIGCGAGLESGWKRVSAGFPLQATAAFASFSHDTVAAAVRCSKHADSLRKKPANRTEAKIVVLCKGFVVNRPMHLQSQLLPGLSALGRARQRYSEIHRRSYHPRHSGRPKVRSTHMLFSFMAELEGGEDTIGQYLRPRSQMNPLRSIIKSYLNPEDADREKETGMTFRRTVYDADNWVRHRSSRRHQRNLLSIGSSRVILALGPPVFGITCLAFIMAALNEAVILGLLPKWWPILHMSALPFQLTAPALALLLVFRTNASYARFDEARRLWANVVVRTRDTIRMALAWIINPVDFGRRQQLLNHVVAFSVCLKHHLTKCETLRDELSGVLEPWEVDRVMASRHKPNYVLQLLAEIIPVCDMTEKQKEIMDKNLTYLNECTGACERIYTTPIPLSYTRLTSRFLVIWHATLPLGLWDQCKWAVIPATFFSAAALLCIEEVGVLIEEPFSILALSSFCSEAREALSELTEAHEVINSFPNLLSNTDTNPFPPSQAAPPTTSPTCHSPPSPTHTAHSSPTPSISQTTPTSIPPSTSDPSLNGRPPPPVNIPAQTPPPLSPTPAVSSLLSYDDDSAFKASASSSSQLGSLEREAFASPSGQMDLERHYPSAGMDVERSRSLSGRLLHGNECGGLDERSPLSHDESMQSCSVSAQISSSIASLGSATAAYTVKCDASFKGPGSPRSRTCLNSSSSSPPPSRMEVPMKMRKKRRRKRRFRQPAGRAWVMLP